MYAASLCMDVLQRLSSTTLHDKLCNGFLRKEDLAGWSWFIMDKYDKIVFVQVNNEGKMLQDLIANTNTIHNNSRCIIDSFHSQWIYKQRNDIWKIDNNDNLAQIIAETTGDFAGCAKYCGFLQKESLQAVISGSPALWLFAQTILVTQVNLGYTDAAVVIQPAGMVKILDDYGGYMLLIHIIPGMQTNDYWDNIDISGSIVLSQYNNCIIG